MTFHQLEGETVILRNNGTYKQAEVYEYDNRIFAKNGSGYILLKQEGKTSLPKAFWENLTVDCVPVALGYIALKHTSVCGQPVSIESIKK